MDALAIKIAIPHVERKHFPLVYFEFTKRIGRHPKVLCSDLASKFTSSSFERYLLVKGVNQVNVPRGEHHSIGVAEKAIQDLSNMMCCMMIMPSIADKNKTIFEAHAQKQPTGGTKFNGWQGTRRLEIRSSKPVWGVSRCC